MPFLAINRREGELRKGFQGSEGEGIERRKKEEERRENEVEALPNRDYDQSLHRSLFGVLRATID